VPVPRCVSRHPEAQPRCALRVTFLAHRPEGAELVRPVILSPSIVLSPSFIVSPPLSATVVVGRDRSLPAATGHCLSQSISVRQDRSQPVTTVIGRCLSRSVALSPQFVACRHQSLCRDRSLSVAARYYSVPVGVCRWLLLCIDRSVCFHRSFCRA
jgi:hypothetical protein